MNEYMKSHIKNSVGFTLIEVMVVVAIIGILAAISYPSYQDSIRKSRRGDAQAGMVELASFMERTFTESNSYAGATITASGISSDYYGYTLPTQTATTYTVRAAPIGDQVNDSCGTMTLVQTGARTTTGTAGCW